jgi:hypothetical protein
VGICFGPCGSKKQGERKMLINEEIIEFSTLKGKILTSITVSGDEEIVFETKDETFKMYHKQDCCEDVHIEDICGDLVDLLDSSILLAEESSKFSSEVEDGDLATWTFYKLSTVKGSITIRWYGMSNGYYSESVDIYKVEG